MNCVREQTSCLLKCGFGVALDGSDLHRNEIPLRVVFEPAFWQDRRFWHRSDPKTFMKHVSQLEGIVLSKFK